MNLQGPLGAAFAALLIIFSGAVQGCGTSDIGPALVEQDVGATGCPAVPCADGLECVGGECIAVDGCWDPDNDGYGPGCTLGDDCAPDDPNVSPGQVEVCNDIDDNCDFYIDEGGVCQPCTPQCNPGESQCSGERIVRCDDSDGCAEWASPVACPAGLACSGGACVVTCTDEDGDGFPIDCPGEREDCDDTNADAFPRNAEVCDGIDNDCDGEIDEFGVCETGCEDECEAGEVACTSDATAVISCTVGPDGCARYASPRLCGSTRSCLDGVCVDEVVCVDFDGDGAGEGCAVADCRPADRTAYQGATEECDGIDDDCDGVIDDGGVCDTCSGSSEAFPFGILASGVAERVSCGGPEYFTLTGPAPAEVAVVVAADGPVSIALGNYDGTGHFVSVVDEGWALGGMVGVTGSGVGGIRVTAAAGTRYVLATAPEGGACEADAMEPNNAPAAGRALGAGTHGARATVCAGDNDFYEVDVLPGQVITAAAAFDADSDGDALIRVWRNGTEVGVSLTGPFDGGFPAGRHTHFRADLPGTYVVGVRGRARNVETSYALGIRAVDSDCTDDGRETTDGLDDDTVGTARRLASNTSTNGTLCPGDIDVLDVGAMREGLQYSGTLEIVSGDNEVDFIVVRDSMRSVFHDGTSDDAVSSFSSNVSTSGQYYVVIYGRNPDATARYEYSHTVR